MKEYDSMNRAERGLKTILFSHQHRQAPSDELAHESLSELIVDLLHFCRHNTIQFRRQLNLAVKIYNYESEPSDRYVTFTRTRSGVEG